jgi:hypothetical protein
MSNTTISQLPSASLPLAGNEVVALDQSGATKKAVASALGALIPQRIIPGASDTFQVTDVGGQLYVQNAAVPCTIHIPNFATVPLRVGTVITIAVDPASGLVTIDTTLYPPVALLWAGTILTGNRTLANQGEATLLKVKQDTWFINGAGLS